jgi:hypothetical protein
MNDRTLGLVFMTLKTFGAIYVLLQGHGVLPGIQLACACDKKNHEDELQDPVHDYLRRRKLCKCMAVNQGQSNYNQKRS